MQKWEGGREGGGRGQGGGGKGKTAGWEKAGKMKEGRAGAWELLGLQGGELTPNTPGPAASADSVVFSLCFPISSQ